MKTTNGSTRCRGPIWRRMGGVALWLALGAAAAPADTAPRPNIVLMMSDDQGWGETGYNGHPHLKTPVLDDMVRAGLRFDRFYAASPNCTPTRTSVMTGRHANRSGAFAPNWSTRPEEVTIAHILRDAGYRTAHFGKWHIGAVKKESPLNPNRMGFDAYLSHDNYFEMDPPLSRNGAPPEIVRGEGSEIIINEAIAFARRVRAEGKPFFIVVWFGSPHWPHVARPDDVAPYAHLGAPVAERFAEITAMDRAIGWFRAALREMEVADDTILWFKSDNGIPAMPRVSKQQSRHLYNGRLRGAKGTLYEGGIRVPAVLEWPAVVTSPRATSVPCVTSDILPTLLDILEIRHPEPKRPLDGASLRPLLVGGAMTARPAPIGFWMYPSGGEAKHGRWIDAELSRGTTPTVRNPAINFLNFKHPVARTENFGGWAGWMDNRYKLLVNERKKPAQMELFDLIADPLEENNIAAANPKVVRRMMAEMEAWQRCVERSLTGADYE